ncbi:hypothetical protein N7454_001927 [Penicillium verhagenii]|nr:hypothetical protein N7454_001927 [Penicillium verhagenii]
MSEQQWERPLGENETFIKTLGDAARSFNREHWTVNIIASVTPLGSLAKEIYHVARSPDDRNVPSIYPISACLGNGRRKLYKRLADEVIASTTHVTYANMTFLAPTRELLGRSQRWRTDEIGGLILHDENWIPRHTFRSSRKRALEAVEWV